VDVDRDVRSVEKESAVRVVAEPHQELFDLCVIVRGHGGVGVDAVGVVGVDVVGDEVAAALHLVPCDGVDGVVCVCVCGCGWGEVASSCGAWCCGAPAARAPSAAASGKGTRGPVPPSADARHSRRTR
jgi:hypothetical protein